MLDAPNEDGAQCYGYFHLDQDSCTSWTAWFDRDDPSGTGDWETLTDLRTENPGQICPAPTAIQARVISTGQDASLTGEQFAYYDTTTGFVCKKNDQSDSRCLDYEVRFCCADTVGNELSRCDSHCFIFPHTGWPTGTYGLPRTNTGCPEAAGVTWLTGYRYHDTEDDDSSNHWTPGLHFDGGYWRNDMYQKFCMKTSSLQGYGNWPSGSYCIFKKGGCPSGFQNGEVFWDDEDDDNRNRVSGQLPHGQYNRNTLIRYCCRNDGSSNTYISLPNRSPFYLFRYRQGCQKVAGMNVREEYFRWDDEDDDNANRLQGAHPYDDGGSSNHRLHYCYYWK
ncbi:uncharacterized protein LOC144884710 [Branchiostoma floridae x Branchiostoma japonicum]